MMECLLPSYYQYRMEILKAHCALLSPFLCALKKFSAFAVSCHRTILDEDSSSHQDHPARNQIKVEREAL